MPNKKYTFKECNHRGSFKGLLTLNENQIIARDIKPNEDGVYLLCYVEDYEEFETYFTDYNEIQNSL